MAKKSPLKRKEARADALWSLAVRARDGRCIVCGKTTDLQAHHAIVRRGHKSTRWDLRNGVSLCSADHIWGLHGRQWDWAKLETYTRAVERMIPVEVREELQFKGRSVCKIDLTAIDNIIYALETYLKMH